MAKRSSYQQKIIRNYYQNRDAIALQRAQELITELYLASGKKRDQYWKQLMPHLSALGIAPETIDHLVKQDDPALVAELIKKKA